MSDLQYASPATVSRCGMVYVEPKNLGYAPYWQRWLRSKLTVVSVHILWYLLLNTGSYRHITHSKYIFWETVILVLIEYIHVCFVLKR